ncbi:hypothetical protein NKI89_24955 [Mesorhizobium sp. M0309]|uniref:hypothetical protein n=1 Tax=Mesorhizobium sp. M0309 TaxID=2956933 RepID=UPI00333B02B2
MTSSYDPSNWYWIVAGSATQVFSSASGNYLPVADTTYQAWLAGGNASTRIASEAELGDVLAPYQIRPAAAGVLDGYKDSQATKLTIEIVAKVLFNHENRLRALEAKQAVTPAQFKSALKDLM